MMKAKFKEKDGAGFVEAYLAAIDLQKTHNKATSVTSHMNLPPEVLLLRTSAAPLLLCPEFWHGIVGSDTVAYNGVHER